MALTDFKITGYRSIHNVWLKMKPINVIVGPNGSGKSNMYRAMYLVACAANGRLARAIAEEGGVSSTLWAGGESGKNAYKRSPLVKLSVRVKQFEYNLAFGEAGPVLRPGIFSTDAQIKREDVFFFKDGRRVQLLKRRLGFLEAKDAQGKRLDYTMRISDSESVLSGLRDPLKFPEMYALRDELCDWRFYHDFRTDPESPLRRPQLRVMTPIMTHDGSDLWPAIATILEDEIVGPVFLERFNDAFPGAQIGISSGLRGSLKPSISFAGINKSLDGKEISEGTLQYLCLMTALLSKRPASMIALNEPETSIHPNLYEPLARLIVQASENSQIWITTHAQELADYILEFSGYEPLELEKVRGETRLKGVGLGGYKDNDDEDEESESENGSDDIELDDDNE